MELERIIKEFREVLSERKEIIASYLYGSALHSDNFKDIDIGLLIEEEFNPELMYVEEIAKALDNRIKVTLDKVKPVDIRLLNGRPLRFQFSVLKNSRLIDVKDESKRIEFESRVMKEYIDIKPHFEMYEEMRKLRYSKQ